GRLRVQDARQRDRVVGPRSEQPGEPAHQPVDRVPELGLVDRGRPWTAVELVAPAVETVRPGCQYLPASGRRRLVHRETLEDIEPARSVRAERRADLGHDDHLIAVADLVLFARRWMLRQGLLALAQRRQ